MKKIVYAIFVVMLSIPLAAWAFFKPVRVLQPQLVKGISCLSSTVCVDNENRFLEASELYKRAIGFTADKLGSFNKRPQAVFCSTERCFQDFGFAKASASHVGKWGIVISPRGWEPYYVRHEMIHHRQTEELGVIAYLRAPEWLIEGMAYSISEDPRGKLSERWQKSRSQFNEWLIKVDRENLWDEIRKL